MAATDKDGVTLSLKGLNEKLESQIGRFDQLESLIVELTQEILKLSVPKPEAELHAPIQKVESFNGEKVPVPADNTKMNDNDKIDSMRNAAKVLPPNHIVNGRQPLGNIQALVGFMVTEDQMDTLYATFSHEV